MRISTPTRSAHQGRVSIKQEPGYSLFFFSSRRRHTRFKCDWSSDVCSSDLNVIIQKDKRVSIPYFDVLKKEIARVGAAVSHEREVVQFHWGGGTPTYSTPAQIGRASCRGRV